MKDQLISMIQVVGLWLFIYLISYLLTKLFGVRGNQLQKSRKYLEKLHVYSSLLLKEMNRNKKKEMHYINRLNRIILVGKKSLSHLDLFIFDHRENKNVAAHREQLSQLVQAYRQMNLNYAKEELNHRQVVSQLKGLNDESKVIIDILTKELERLDK